MKYKKLLVFITCLLFVTVAVFCFASAFKVTDVEVKVTTVDGSSENIDGLCGNYLKRYEGKNLIFVNTDNITSDLTSLSGYLSVVSVEKQYPNKILVTVKEKVEKFVIASSNAYYALDGDLCVLKQKSDVKNNVDGSSNLLIKLSLSDYSQDLKVGQTLNVYDGVLLSLISSSKDALYERKTDLVSVEFTTKIDGLSNKRIIIKTKEGSTFTILKADEKTSEKLAYTFSFYDSLSNKGVGDYETVLKDDGNISVSLAQQR